jgi:amino acid transporter
VILHPVGEMQSAPALKRELGLRDLTLFAVSCVISARWIPIAAHAGPGSVTLWLLAAVFFVMPLTVAVAALVAKYPGAGGLYLWTRGDFGPWNGFPCLSAASGAAITALALLTCVVPPTEIKNVWPFECKLAAGTLAVVASAWAMYRNTGIDMVHVSS